MVFPAIVDTTEVMAAWMLLIDPVLVATKLDVLLNAAAVDWIVDWTSDWIRLSDAENDELI